MNPAVSQPLRPLRWEDAGLTFVDQRRLPRELVFGRAVSVAEILAAIETAAITGGRQVALSAAFGTALARRAAAPGAACAKAIAALRAASAPWGTASIEHVLAAPAGAEGPAALELLADTVTVDAAIAGYGAALLPHGSAVLTLGNSGALSTGGLGTAAGAIIAAHAAGKRVHVYVSETRPLATGLRLTAFECMRAGVSCTIVPDSAAAAIMRTGRIAAVLVAATAMAANGDLGAELGTYALAIAAARHRIPFYVFVPRAGIDRSASTGEALLLAPSAAREPWPNAVEQPQAYHAVSSSEDRTPANLITGIVTEYGVARPPFDDALANLATRPGLAFVTRSSA